MANREIVDEPEIIQPTEKVVANSEGMLEKIPNSKGDVEGSNESIESIEQPSKVIRMGAMLGQLLEEVRAAEVDEAGRERLKEIYELSVKELGSAVSDDLKEELNRLAKPFGEGETPSGSELRVAKAQLVGWLEGLVQGIQATLYAQQVAARQQLSDIRQQMSLPKPSDKTGDIQSNSPGAYL